MTDGAQLYIRECWANRERAPRTRLGLRRLQVHELVRRSGGKVKTALGLFNDTQDMDSLFTFALLPQEIYPVDQRGITIAHQGGDVFGDIAVKHIGIFSYTGYAGMRPRDSQSGYDYAYKGQGIVLSSLGGLQTGGDWRLTMQRHDTILRAIHDQRTGA